MRRTNERASELEALLPLLMRSLYWRGERDAVMDLPLAQLRVVKVLYEGDKTPTELAEALRMSLSALTQLTHRLEESGWVERAADATDRRVKHLQLSPWGRERMETRRAGRIDRVRQVLETMTESEQEMVLDSLSRLLQACQRTCPPQAESIQLTAELEEAR